MSESAFSALVSARPVDPSRIGGMSDLRLIDLNLIYAIKEKILPINGYTSRFTETLAPGQQTLDPETGLTVTPYKATFMDWVYYNPDPSNPALTGLLTVPNISTSGDLAFVDYQNGVINYSGIKSDNINITYDYYTVYVQDGYPDFGEEAKNMNELRIPMVTVEYTKRMNDPFQLGGGYSQDRMFMIDVIGHSDPQRDDILDLLEDSLRYDYNETINYAYGFPLKFNGDVNQLFDRGPASRWREIRFEHTDSDIIHDMTGEEKFRHRGMITLDIKTWN